MQLRRLAYCGLLAAGALLALMPGTAAGYQIEDNQVATSFDGTSIVYTLFLPDNASASNPVPAVLRTHGWGGSGSEGRGDGSAPPPPMRPSSEAASSPAAPIRRHRRFTMARCSAGCARAA